MAMRVFPFKIHCSKLTSCFTKVIVINMIVELINLHLFTYLFAMFPYFYIKKRKETGFF